MSMLTDVLLGVGVDYFYRAAWNVDASSDENSVCLSVLLFVTRVDCDKTL